MFVPVARRDWSVGDVWLLWVVRLGAVGLVGLSHGRTLGGEVLWLDSQVTGSWLSSYLTA